MIDFGGIELDPVEIGSQGNAILGIRDSGKTYTAMLLAEGLFDAGIPFVAFDPIGVWRFLRVPGKGKGYPIVVAGGQDGDLPLTVQSAPLIVEAAMTNGVSLVIDLFHMDLSKADWRRIVRESVKLLLHRNKAHGLRHIFLEEAAEFVPQKVNDWDVYAEIEKLARMGGNSGLGYTLINQRSQEVNKAVLELCENLFLHRQKGKLSIENLKRWLDVAGASASGIIASLPTLAQGECWAWLAGSDLPLHVQVPTKNSLHPDRRIMHGDTAAVVKKAVSVSKFVTALQATLPKIEEEARAKDPKLLKARVVELEKLIAGRAAAAAAGPSPSSLSLTAERDGLIGAVRDLQHEVAALRPAAAGMKMLGPALADVGRRYQGVVKALESLDGSIDQILKIAESVDLDMLPKPGPLKAVPSQRRAEYAPPPPPAAATTYERPQRIAVDGDVEAVPSGCNKALGTLANMYPGGMTESQWATAAGYKVKGGTWGEYRRRLVRAEMIQQRDGLWYATALGASSAGPVELPPEPGPELARWWAKKTSGTPKMVEALLEAWPHRITRDELGERMNMVTSGGTFGEYIRRLRRNNIVDENKDGVLLSTDVMGPI